MNGWLIAYLVIGFLFSFLVLGIRKENEANGRWIELAEKTIVIPFFTVAWLPALVWIVGRLIRDGLDKRESENA